ncbi:MAG TPA: LptA/OstA family protein [Longimicrobium sp.]|nr:LptA/OstA family protein [Longimicrobium sp.]
MARRLLAAALGALALCLAVPSRAAAQNTCELVYQNGPWTSVGDPAQRVISADGPLLVRCSAGEELRADSAVIYQTINEVHLFGQVDYQDPGRALTSDQATYNSATGRLYATGNVVFTDKNRGSTLRGPELEYFRAAPGRPDAQAIATGRPHLTVTPKPGRSGERRDPMEVDADRITSVGERFVTAEGNAVIVSKDTRSTAEEAYYDADEERVELRRNARVDSEKYDLTGNFIETRLEDGAIRQVLSRTNARLESERMTATGPQLQLFFERDLLQRTVASREPGTAAAGDSTAAGPRSVALSKGFRLEADSIEAISPDQRLRQVNAVGKAQGISWDTIPPAPRVVTGDSAGDSGQVRAIPVSNPPAASATTPPEGLEGKDVLTADTIVAFFRQDSAAAAAAGTDSAGPRVLGTPAAPATPARPDTAAGDTAATEIERLVATGDARSLYRMRPDSTKPAETKSGLNYLIGDQIELKFVDGEVDVAHVRGLKRGVYLDPAQPRAAGDSATAAAGDRPGTGGATTDGGAARPAGRAPASPPRPAPTAPPPAPAPAPRPPATRTIDGRQP